MNTYPLTKEVVIKSKVKDFIIGKHHKKTPKRSVVEVEGGYKTIGIYAEQTITVGDLIKQREEKKNELRSKQRAHLAHQASVTKKRK